MSSLLERGVDSWSDGGRQPKTGATSFRARCLTASNPVSTTLSRKHRQPDASMQHLSRSLAAFRPRQCRPRRHRQRRRRRSTRCRPLLLQSKTRAGRCPALLRSACFYFLRRGSSFSLCAAGVSVPTKPRNGYVCGAEKSHCRARLTCLTSIPEVSHLNASLTLSHPRHPLGKKGLPVLPPPRNRLLDPVVRVARHRRRSISKPSSLLSRVCSARDAYPPRLTSPRTVAFNNDLQRISSTRIDSNERKSQ